MSGAKQPQFVDTNVLIYAHDRWSGDFNPGQTYEHLSVVNLFA